MLSVCVSAQLVDFDNEEKAVFDQSAEEVNSLISAMKKILTKLT